MIADNSSLETGTEVPEVHAEMKLNNSSSNFTFDEGQLFGHPFVTLCDFLPDPFPAPILTFFVVVYLVIIIVALFGNLLVILVIAVDRKMRTVTNVLLVSLALSDTLIASLNMPFQLSFLIQNEWTMGVAMCKFTGYIQGVVVVTSIFTLTGIAVDRYYAICRPLQARHLHTISRAILLVCFFWLTAFVLLVPQAFIQRLDRRLHFDPHLHSYTMVEICVEYFGEEYFGDSRLNVAYTLFFYVALYLLPVAIMFVSYGRIGLTLWRRSPLAEASPGVRADICRRLAEKKRVVRMLVVIVTLFSVSWFPFFSAQIYHLFDSDRCHGMSRLIIALLQLCAYSNCAINPVVYCLLNDSFKQSLRRAVSGACNKGRLHKLAWSGRRPTLTETLRTTAGLFTSSHRRSSVPNGVLSRQTSSTPHAVNIEGLNHFGDATAHWFNMISDATKHANHHGLHSPLVPDSNPTDAVPARETAMQEFQGDAVRVRNWISNEEFDGHAVFTPDRSKHRASYDGTQSPSEVKVKDTSVRPKSSFVFRQSLTDFIRANTERYSKATPSDGLRNNSSNPSSCASSEEEPRSSDAGTPLLSYRGPSCPDRNTGDSLMSDTTQTTHGSTLVDLEEEGVSDHPIKSSGFCDFPPRNMDAHVVNKHQYQLTGEKKPGGEEIEAEVLVELQKLEMLFAQLFKDTVSTVEKISK